MLSQLIKPIAKLSLVNDTCNQLYLKHHHFKGDISHPVTHWKRTDFDIHHNVPLCTFAYRKVTHNKLPWCKITLPHATKQLKTTSWNLTKIKSVKCRIKISLSLNQIIQASQQYCCWVACKISKWYGNWTLNFAALRLHEIFRSYGLFNEHL